MSTLQAGSLTLLSLMADLAMLAFLEPMALGCHKYVNVAGWVNDPLEPDGRSSNASSSWVTDPVADWVFDLQPDGSSISNT